MLITLSYPAKICQSVVGLVDRCGSFGGCKPQIQLLWTTYRKMYEIGRPTLTCVQQREIFSSGDKTGQIMEGGQCNIEKTSPYIPQNNSSLEKYRSPNIVKVIKSRRLRWAGHVARTEEGRSAFKILTGKPTGGEYLGPRGMRMGSGEGSTMKNVIVCTVHLIYSG